MVKIPSWAPVLGVLVAFAIVAPAAAQAPIELTQTDVTKLKALDASQWSLLGVRLGETKENALKLLQKVSNVSVQDDAAAGRLFLLSPANSKTAVASLKIVEHLVTAINVVGNGGEWLQGDTKLLFRAFEDDSLRFKFLGREDHREAARGGTEKAPSLDVTYAYYKEGVLLHYSVKRSEDGKQLEGLREMVLIFPARSR